MAKPIYILNGPTLNLLGEREPHIYGTDTLKDVERLCAARAKGLGYEIVFRQSNREGEIVDWILEARTEGAALVINPAAYGHTSIAFHDALQTLSIPVVECHLSNPQKREAFRHHSYVSTAAKGVIVGFGAMSYELAVEAAARLAAQSAKV